MNRIRKSIAQPIQLMLLTTMLLSVATGIEAQSAKEHNHLSAEQSWTVNTGDQKRAMLRFLKGDFYLSNEEDEQPQSTFAGSIVGLEVGKAGLYVGNLDGNSSGATSVAFYDPTVRTWYFGTFSGSQLTFAPVDGEVFHVGEGPTLYPVDGDPTDVLSSLPAPRSLSQTERLKPLDSAAQSSTPIFPIYTHQYTKLATSRNMTTDSWIYPDGSLTGITTAHNGVWLTGYHGGVQVTLFDEYNRPVYSYTAPRLGTTGTAFGAPNATLYWRASVPQNALALARQISIYQYWDPDFTTIINGPVGQWLKFVLPFIQPIKTALG